MMKCTACIAGKHATRLSDVQHAAERCNASRAKFNKEKMEAIPIGTCEYRQRLVETRTFGQEEVRLPEELKIARDGTPVRMLGAWLGNNVDEKAMVDELTIGTPTAGGR